MGKVRFGQSGYVGMSKSVRAYEAEEEGKLPLTRAIVELSRRAGVTRKDARAALVSVGPCEWHHSGKFANRVNYYDIDEVMTAMRYVADPFGEEVEEAEYWEEVERDGGIDSDPGLPPVWDKNDYRYHLTIDQRLALGETESPAWAKARQHQCEKNQHSANFRRWEAVLRRLAARCE